MAKIQVISTPEFKDNWVYGMYKNDVILKKLEKLKCKMIWKTGDTQTDGERYDILWVKQIIKDFPDIKPGRHTMELCNELWKKYK